MAFGLKHMHGPQWLSGGLHVFILAVAVQADAMGTWPFALIAIATVSFFAWLANYRRYRQINDLPTSRVASAAQGYVELFGRAKMLPGEPVLSRLSRWPCCWYSYEIMEKDSDNRWRTVDSGTSVEQFLLVDESGECVISPEGAEVLSDEHRSWMVGDEKYTEDLLLPSSKLYAVGEFSTTTAAAAAAAAHREESADVSALLAEWKEDQRQLLHRFDLDRDGKLDLKEWELARLQARREVRRRNAELGKGSVDGVHLLRKPADGRLFLIANEMPAALGTRFRRWSWLHLTVLIGAGIAGLAML